MLQNSPNNLRDNNDVFIETLWNDKQELTDKIILFEMKLNELNISMFHEKENAKKLYLTYSEINVKNIELLNQIKDLEEQEGKFLNLISQGNENFERMLTIEKENGNNSGLGYDDFFSQQTTYAHIVKTGLERSKENTKVISNIPRKFSYV